MDKATKALIRHGTLKCCICGLIIQKAQDANREHEPPRCRGGTKWKWAHRWCNADKGALTMEEYREFCRLRAIRNGDLSKIVMVDTR